MSTLRPLAPLAPAPPKPRHVEQSRVTFYDLPAELRIEIYRMALEGVTIHIKPLGTPDTMCSPQPFSRVSKQVRNEALPLIHSLCPITSTVQDFNFDGVLAWIARVPPHEEGNLAKNKSLTINLATSGGNQPYREMASLRHWLHMRSDKFRPYPNWVYQGPQPGSKVCADLRRRCKRLKEYRRQKEMVKILEGINILPPAELLRDDEGEESSASGPRTIAGPASEQPPSREG